MPTPSVPNTFTPNTTILSADVNANFAALVSLLSILDSLNIAAKGINPGRLADGANPEIFWPQIAPTSGFTLTGYTFVSSSGLSVDIAAGIAWALKTSAGLPNTWVYVRKTTTSTRAGLSATSDNYIDLRGDGTFLFTPVAIGGNAPPLLTDTTRIMIATTDATTVTGTTDKRTLSFQITQFPPFYHSGLFIFPDATTPDEKIRLRSGANVRDRDNSVNITTTAELLFDATVVGAGGVDVGALAANEKWFLHLLRDSTGAVADNLFASKTLGVAPPGTHDKIFRIGAFFTNGTSDILHFFQQGDEVRYRDDNQVATQVTTSLGTFTTRDPSAFVPTTSRLAKLVFTMDEAGGVQTIFGADGDKTGGTGGTTLTQTAGDIISNSFDLPLNATQLYALRTSGSIDEWTEFCRGYVDDLSVQA